jgi:hypothetical protein
LFVCAILKQKERNRIALEEAELSHKQKLLEQVRDESGRLQREHVKWMEEKRLVLEAEERRRKEGIAAEKSRILQLKSLDHETRKARLELLRRMEESARETLEEASKTLQAEYQRLESTLAAQQQRMDFEISSRKQEEELQHVEFETEQRVMDVHRHRAMEEKMQRLRAEFATRLKQQEMEDLLKFATWKREDEERKHNAKIELQQREQQVLFEQEQRLRQELETQFLEQATAKEKEILELEAQRRARQVEQDRRISSTRPSQQKRTRDAASVVRDQAETHATSRDHHVDSFEATTPRSTHPVATPVRPKDVSSERYDQWGKRQVRHESTENAPPPLEAQTPRRTTGASAATSGGATGVSSRGNDHSRRLDFDSSSGSNESSVASAAMQRTMEEMRLLEKALANISSSISSHSSSFVADDEHRPDGAVSVSATALPQSRTPTGRRTFSHPRQSPERQQDEARSAPPYVAEDGAPTPAGTYQPLSPPARDRMSSQYHEEGSSNFSHFDIHSVDLEEKASDHDEVAVDDDHHQADKFQFAEGEAVEPRQRPIAELEAKLGIRFDDLSDDDEDEADGEEIGDDHGAGSSSSLSSSSVDEAIEDDRARLLSRAKKLLEEESFDSDDDLSEGLD